MSNPVDHHILPKCHLKGFVDDAGYIWTSNTKDHPNSQIRRSSPSGTGYSKNYFKITHDRPLGAPFVEDPLVIEKKMNHFYETKLPQLWNEILKSDGQLSINSKFEIARTIFHLKMRSRKSRSLFFTRDHIEHLMLSSVNELFSSPNELRIEEIEELGLTVEQYRVLLTEHYYKTVIDPGDESQFHNGFLLKFNQQMSPVTKAALWRLVQGNWTILTCQADESFILNDNPGNSIDDKNEVFNFFGRDKFEFYFPINKRTCIKVNSFGQTLTMEKLNKVSMQVVDKKSVDKINLISLAGSFSEIYGDSPQLIQSLRTNMHQRFEKNEINIAEMYSDLKENFGRVLPSNLWK